METCFNYVDKERAYFSSDERRYVNKVRKLKEKYPKEVRIIAEPEENNGCIYCELPAAWFTIRVPKKMNFSEEHKAELAERMRHVRDGKQVCEQRQQKTDEISVPWE